MDIKHMSPHFWKVLHYFTSLLFVELLSTSSHLEKKLLSALIWQTLKLHHTWTMRTSGGMLPRGGDQARGCGWPASPRTTLTRAASIPPASREPLPSPQHSIYALFSTLLNPPEFSPTFLLNLVEPGPQWQQRHPWIFSYSCCSTSKAAPTGFGPGFGPQLESAAFRWGPQGRAKRAKLICKD